MKGVNKSVVETVLYSLQFKGRGVASRKYMVLVSPLIFSTSCAGSQLVRCRHVIKKTCTEHLGWKSFTYIYFGKTGNYSSQMFSVWSEWRSCPDSDALTPVFQP